MQNRVRLSKLEDMLKPENLSEEGFLAPDLCTIQDVYDFSALYPHAAIAAIVLRIETRLLCEPKNSQAVLTVKTLSKTAAKEAIQRTHRQSFKTRMQFLSETRNTELTEVLLNSAEKPASHRTILANGGVFEKMIYVERFQRDTNHYWIHL